MNKPNGTTRNILAAVGIGVVLLFNFLAMAKDTPTRAEMKQEVSSSERRLDKRLDRIEDKLDTVLEMRAEGK